MPTAREQPRQSVLNTGVRENAKQKWYHPLTACRPPQAVPRPQPSPLPTGTPARGPSRPCPRPPAAPTHRAAVRGHVEDEERAARRMRGVCPFPHLVLLHQQPVGRALPLRELHRQSCEGRSSKTPLPSRPRSPCCPSPTYPAGPAPGAPRCPSPVYPAGASPAARAVAAAIFSARGSAEAAGSCGSPGAARAW